MTLDDLNQITVEETDFKDLVIISFGKFDGLDEIHKLDRLLYESIPEEIGCYDGHEVNMDDTDGRLFIYGYNAEELYKTIEPLLKSFEFLKNANVYLRFTKNGEFTSDLEFKMNK